MLVINFIEAISFSLSVFGFRFCCGIWVIHEYYRLLSDEYGNPAELLAKIIIAKNRSGKIGDISLKRDEQFTFFTDWDKIPDSFIIPENRHGDIR